jgi:hypothetical protein
LYRTTTTTTKQKTAVKMVVDMLLLHRKLYAYGHCMGGGRGQVWQLCGVGVVGYEPTTPPQSWPTHPPHLHHKPTTKVAGFVVKLWCQSLVAGPCSHGAGQVWEATTL